MATGTLAGKTLFITGASRGIGLAIALRAARDGANVAIAAKTVKPDPRLPGTIFTAAEEIEKAGGKALPLPCDIRDEQSVDKAVANFERRMKILQGFKKPIWVTEFGLATWHASKESPAKFTDEQAACFMARVLPYLEGPLT